MVEEAGKVSLEQLGTQLLSRFVTCIAEMMGVDMGTLGTPKLYLPDEEPCLAEPMTATVEFAGTKTCSLVVTAEEKSLADVLGIENLPAVDKREDERRQYEGLFTEAANVAAAECLTIFQVGERSFVSILAPRLIYGILRIPQVDQQRLYLETSFGTFYATVVVDTMKLDIQRMTDELWQSRIELKEALVVSEKLRMQADLANRSKSEFLANMSHEIRTPLNGVLGIAESLAEDETHPEKRADLEAIVGSGKSLLSILNDILDYSKMEAGFLSVESRDFDLVKILRQVAKLFESQATNKGLTLSLDLHAEEHSFVRGDELRLLQVLSNLLSNAIKFTDDGGVILKCRQTDGGDDMVRLVIDITDTGVGMAPEVLEHVFERFTQADGSTTRRFGGTGLGLAISKGLLDMMGGEIEVTSTLGQGTTFSVALSMKTASEQTDDDDEADIDRMLGRIDGLRILVVDDNAINQVVACRILQRWRCHVDTANDGSEAVEILKQGSYDIVLMDCMMPVMDGYEATRQIRAMASPRCDVPIIAMTANVLAEDHQRCHASGMNAVVTKPIQKMLLLPALVKRLDELKG